MNISIYRHFSHKLKTGRKNEINTSQFQMKTGPGGNRQEKPSPVFKYRNRLNKIENMTKKQNNMG